MRKRIAAWVLSALVLLPLLFSCAAEPESEPDESFADVREALRYVIHAAGRLEGPDSWGGMRDYDGSNSREGLEQCAEAGVRAVELDFNFSSDGQLVCLHDWYPEYADGIEMDVPLTLEEFLGLRLYGCFTPIWLGDVADWLRANTDAYIVTDIKDDNLAGCRAIAQFCPDLLDRFVVQIYSRDEYDAVRALGFDYVLFTLYRLDWEGKTDWHSLGEFAASHPLAGYVFSAELCGVDGYVEGMLRSGTALYVHTVNENADAYFEMGITGVYTDLIP